MTDMKDFIGHFAMVPPASKEKGEKRKKMIHWTGSWYRGGKWDASTRERVEANNTIKIYLVVFITVTMKDNLRKDNRRTKD